MHQNRDDDDPWLLAHLPRVAPDATRVKPLPNTRGGEVKARSAYELPSIPLPEPEPKQSREGWLMSHLSDVLPVVGEMRGVQAAHAAARSGHPIAGAAIAGLSLLPMGARLAKLGKGARVFEHYSNADLSGGVLDPRFMGTGKTGREAAREGRVGMMHVYTEGARPEPEFARMPKYQVHLPANASIYDIATDPEGIAAKVMQDVRAGKVNGHPATVLEKRIQRAGHAGFTDSYNSPTIVKLYGEHPVTPAKAARGRGVNAPPEPEPASLPAGGESRGNPHVMDVLSRFQRESGQPNLPRVTAVDPERAQHMAKTYEKLPKHDQNAAAAYDALNKEVDAQYQAILDSGHTIEFTDADPYKNSKEMFADVRDNKRLKVFKTPRPAAGISAAAVRYDNGDIYTGASHADALAAGVKDGLPFEKARHDGFIVDGHFASRQDAFADHFGGEDIDELHAGDIDLSRAPEGKFTPQEFHPYMTPEQNDKFRAVHDWLAHAGEGHSFGPIGEENAYRVHASTLSPLARRALATETRGQNSWVNFGPHSHLPVTQRPFAEQKAALWPEELTGDYDAMPRVPNLGDGIVPKARPGMQYPGTPAGQQRRELDDLVKKFGPRADSVGMRAARPALVPGTFEDHTHVELPDGRLVPYHPVTKAIRTGDGQVISQRDYPDALTHIQLAQKHMNAEGLPWADFRRVFDDKPDYLGGYLDHDGGYVSKPEMTAGGIGSLKFWRKAPENREVNRFVKQLKAKSDSVAERIVHSAIRTPAGVMFRGRMHMDAVQSALDAGFRPHELAGSDEGFITSTGRYVSREEAQQIAHGAKQPTVGGRFGRLQSEDLMQPEAPKPPRKAFETYAEYQKRIGARPDSAALRAFIQQLQ